MRFSRVSRFALSMLIAVVAVSTAPIAPLGHVPQAAFAALPTAALNAVTFVPSSTVVIAAGAGGTILRSTNNGAGWTSVGPGGNREFTGVSFLDSTRGWVVDKNGAVFSTTNGGATWSLASANLDADPYSGIVHDTAFIEPSPGQDAGYAVGGLGLTLPPVGTGSAHVWYRFNAAGVGSWTSSAWDRSYADPSFDELQGTGEFYALDFPSNTRGYAVGHDRYKQGSTTHNRAVVFYYNSISGGWSVANRMGAGTGPLYDASFATESAGLAVGTQGRIFRTLDGGVMWTQTTVGSADFLGVAMSGQSKAWAVGKNGAGARTTNGGSSWTGPVAIAPTSVELRAVATPGDDSDVAVAVGTSGQIWRTTNGTSWSQAGELTAPTGTITINSGATATNSTAVTASHTVNWGTGGTGQMRHSVNGGSSWTTWETYAATKALTLPSGEGTKSVRVEFKDAADTLSTALIEDTIILDITAPTGTVSIAAGAAYTNTAAVIVTNSVNFAIAGAPAQAMRHSFDGGSTWVDGGEGWVAYAASRNVTLPTGEGIKTLTAQFRDNAGNTASMQDTIILDTTAPTGTIQINGGNSTTADRDVTVTNQATDTGSGVTQMRHSTDRGATWPGGWVAFAPTRGVVLPSVDGEKTVTAEFKDAAGNISSVGTISDTIVLAGSTPALTIENDAAGVTFDRFVTGYSSAYAGGGYVYGHGKWAGTKLQARFTGSSITWYGPKQPVYGMADVYVDGVFKGQVDCYAPAGSATLNAPLITIDGLTDGPHTLQIRPKMRTATNGSIVVIDYFEVEGASPAAGGIRHDEMTGTLSGPWIKGTNIAYIGNAYHYSRYTNASFTKTFTGTKIAWIGPKTNGYGRAKVYIDGRLIGTVSQYGATGWRERVWESATLSRGTHTLKIVPTGTKDAASKGTIVVVDAFDVTP